MLNLANGIPIDFNSAPFQRSPPTSPQLDDNEVSCIDAEIEALISKGAIIPVMPTKSHFISNIFARPKKSGGFRTIINLKKLHRHLEKRHFKMEHIPTILPLIQRNAFMTSIDLQDAYFSLPIMKRHRKYLRFIWRNTLYEFQCLCFGLSLAPFYFTKAMKPVFSQLRREGIHCTHYIDDSMYISPSAKQLQKDTSRARALLQSLGFTINLGKSSFQPSRRITHLGFVIDSESYTVSLPKEKVNKIQLVCRDLLNARYVTIRQFARGIGLIVSSFLAVKYAKLHTRYLEIYKAEQLQRLQDFDKQIYLSTRVRLELKWWVENIATHNGRSISDIIGFDNWHYEIYSDASTLGWGAALFQNSQVLQRTGGRWSTREKNRHINYLELKAIHFALLAFRGSIQNCNVRLNCDNTTAISYINKFGGCRSVSLNYLSRQIWLWCIHNKVSINAVHIPGLDNQIADTMSRKFSDNIEWSLDNQIFNHLCQAFGKPQIDLFASRLNKKLSHYFSWRPDPFCCGVNAFAHTWDNIYGYAFPPFNQISKILYKLSQHVSCTIILICPFWPSQPWFPSLSSFMIDFPLLLPSSSTLLRNPGNPESVHPLLPRMKLVACKLSANSYLQTNFRQKLLTSCSPAGRKARKRTTPQSFDNGCLFALHDTLIPVHHL